MMLTSQQRGDYLLEAFRILRSTPFAEPERARLLESIDPLASTVAERSQEISDEPINGETAC